MGGKSSIRESGRKASRLKGLAISVLSLVALASVLTIPQAQGSVASDNAVAQVASEEGAAFAMTNATADNQIISYSRAADGTLTKVGSISTGGNGIGVDLDTQGGLRLSSDHRFLYAVNAGSDNITVFSVDGTDLTLVQKVYAGDQPSSLTIHDDLLYVQDGSVAGNGILGFRVASEGTLTEIPDSFRLLSSPIAVPGQVEFSPDGRRLLVTHKTTNVLLSPHNAIDSFRVRTDGLTSATPKRLASHGPSSVQPGISR